MYTCIFVFFETNRMIVFEEKKRKSFSFTKGIEKKEDETKRRKCIFFRKKLTQEKKDTTKKTRKP